MTDAHFKSGANHSADEALVEAFERSENVGEGGRLESRDVCPAVLACVKLRTLSLINGSLPNGS